MSKRILVVNDMHVGSTMGIMPDKVELDDGNTVYANKLQRELYSNWRKMIDDIGHVDVCICNGDLCDGINYIEDGNGLWTVDKDIQVQTAAELLKDIKADNYHGLCGSGYHTGNKYNLDEMVMKELEGTFDMECVLNYEDVVFHVRHETGFTSVPYTRSNPLNKDMVNTILEREEYGHIDVFLRAHTHYTHGVLWKGMFGLITPCWKYKDAFIRKRQNVGCDLGYTIFDVDDGEYTYNVGTFTLPRRLATLHGVHGDI